MLPTSVGEGRKSITASNTLCTPLFLNADPHKVGTKALSRHPFFKASLISSGDISSPSKYFSINASSKLATSSTKKFLHLSASAFNSSGISMNSNSAPWELSLYWIAFIFVKSIIPLKSSPAPIGSAIGNGLAPSLFFMVSIAL